MKDWTDYKSVLRQTGNLFLVGALPLPSERPGNDLGSDPMLLIMCQASATRYAIDSRHVREVLPRVHLHRLAGSPPWFAGVLICRAAAIPVMDLTELTEGKPCPPRLSSRIVILQTGLEGVPRQFGVLAEHVSLCEIGADLGELGGGTAGPTALGNLHLDEQGVFELIDIPRLVPGDRLAVLFPGAERER
jgi:chemotaxis-related protein WspB